MFTLPHLKPIKTYKSIALLTSGGDSPGMNPAIRGIVRTALNSGIENVYGVRHGYSGLIGGDIHKLTSRSVTNIVQRGGTMLKSARCLEFKVPQVRAKAAAILKEKGIEALIVIGGDGSMTGAHLFTEETGLPVIGLPGTIDNDIPGSDDTIGFDTAVNTALGAIDRIRDTALSHESLFLVEVMGRNSGFIATQVGIACGAELVVVPEYEFDLHDLCVTLAKQRANRLGSSGIIVIAEGKDPGLTSRIAYQLEELGQEPKICILGHIQRGGSPSGHDRMLASCLGASAVQYLLAGYNDIMVGVQQGAIIDIPLRKVITDNKTLDQNIFAITTLLHK
ncbi:6-phosphofructokinase [Neptunomonas sp.]|uniref:6-phosphofructokinase n=1 Tax=Neptunomonas sp. TaxID=1971898 RepID=UPI0035694CEF